jgi:hypothetical protein
MVQGISRAHDIATAKPFLRIEVEQLQLLAGRIRETTHGLCCPSSLFSTPAAECTSITCAWVAWDIARDILGELQQRRTAA